MQTSTVNLLWHPQAQFAGYLAAERLDLGAPWSVKIKTSPLRIDTGPVKPVLDGECLFGVASPAHLLAANTDTLRLLLVFQQDSPLVYPVRRDSGIERLSDLEGRRVGVWPGDEDIELRWMLQKVGLGHSSVHRIPQMDTAAPFLAGETDCAQMTLYSELHRLGEAGLGPQSLRIFRAADQRANLVKDGFFTSRALIERDPDLVQATVNAVLAGWAHAFENPRETAALCAQSWPGLSLDGQLQQLTDIRNLTFQRATLSEGLGYPDPDHIHQAAMALTDLDQSPDTAKVANLIAANFWTAAPDCFKLRA